MEPSKKELILAAIVLIALPVLAEVGLRIAGVEFEPQLYQPNRERGWVLRPDATGVVTGENKQAVRIDSLGFRDRERSYEKPHGTFRIAVLGNSWTEALQVPLEKTYPAVLEQELNSRVCFGGEHVEVLNFGVAGYSTAQELLTLRQEVWKYKPDLILLAFYPARDVANNVRELNNAANPEQSPYFVFNQGRLIEDDSFASLPALQPRAIALQQLRYNVNDRSKSLQAIAALQRLAKLRLATAAVRERAERSGFENLEYAIYAPPETLAMQKGWAVTEGLIGLMKDEAGAHGAQLRVIVLATRPQVLPDPAKKAELEKKLGVSDLSYADRRIQALCTSRNIPMTLLSSALGEYAESHRVYLNGFSERNWGMGHWNETGHRLAAATIAKDLCDSGASSEKVGSE